MQLITEAQVAAHLDPDAARPAPRAVFAQLGRGQAQLLARPVAHRLGAC